MNEINPNEKNTLDLGCGADLRTEDGHNAYGTDLSEAVKGENIFKINHIWETMEDEIPDNSIDKIFAYDFLEHIPTILNYKSFFKFHTKFPRIILLNDIWRILKPGGVFESKTPYFAETNPHFAWAQDPTHTDVPWTTESWKYFSDDPEWEKYQKIYGINARFHIEEMEEIDNVFLKVIAFKKM